MMIFNKKIKIFLLPILANIMLWGCGSDSEEKLDLPINQSPTVTISGDTSIAEKQLLNLTANTADTDGTIASISWSVTTGEGITLSGAESENVSFTTPNIDTDTIITLTVVVTDNDGATATQEISITITPIKAELTITGLVTDNIIKNSDVEIVIDGEVFTATADENGVYTITITVDESLINELVKIHVLGDTSINPEVEFVSQLGSLSSLIAQAGADGTLVKEDNFGVNVTNVTTAEYALITRDGTTPTTDEELNTAIAAVNSDEKNTLAALIKIIVDNDDYELPNGVTTTLEFVNDNATATAFEQEIIAQEPTLVTETISTIINDNSLTVESGIVGTWDIGSETITFTRSGHYVHIATEADDDDGDDCRGQIGYEIGSYTWNKTTGFLSFTTTEDTNGCYGLNNKQPLNTLIAETSLFTVTEDTLTVTETDESYDFPRLISESNPFVGGYYLQQTNFSNDLSMLITLDDSKSVLLFHLNSSTLPAGISYLFIMRNYSYDAQSSQHIVHSQKVYVDGNITSEQNEEVRRTHISVQSNVISMTKEDSTSFINNSYTTSTQDYLTNDLIIGNFSGTLSGSGDDSDIAFNVSFNEDGTAHGKSEDGGSSFEWKIHFGQLLISQDDGATEIWSAGNLSNDTWQFTVTQYDEEGNFNGSSAGTFTASDIVVSAPTKLFIEPLFSFEKTDGAVYGTGAVQSPTVAEKPLLLDIYQPTGDNVPMLRPGVILVHGGGFQVGDRLKQAENAQQFAQRGYTAVSIDYRLTSDDPATTGSSLILRATFAAIEDTLKAVKWMKDNAEDLGVDPNRIVLGGYSAGAVASLYAAFADQGEEYKVQAVLDLAGSHINVANYIDANDPALFIVHGVLEINEGVDAIEAAAKEAGIKHAIYHLDGIGHAETLYELDHWVEDGVALRTLLSQFLYEVLDLENLGK
ncbi:MAG: carboxylesterase family protein [Colwellia sp.]|nr:carboxylesterase family protein [Colwellia sp.]